MESSDGGTTIVTDQDGVITDDDAADPDASAAEDDTDGATSDTDGDDPTEPSADTDTDTDQASAAGISGAGDGQITIDGETVTLDTVERCEPFDAGDFTRLPDETDWFFRDPNVPLDQVPVEVVNDRATGAGDLEAVGSDDQVSSSFDLSIPAEFSC